jgi:predicted phage-related endonuclease
MIEARPITDREQWLQWRREHVTASVVASLPAFDCHPDKKRTPLRLYIEKRGTEFSEQDSGPMRRGRWFEPSVPQAIKDERPDWSIEAAETYFCDPESRLGCTPDFFIHGDPRGRAVLQAKTVSPPVFHKEWLDGTEIPQWIVLQVRLETMLTDAAFGVVGVLMVDAYDPQIAILDVPRDPMEEQKIYDAAKQFWIAVAEGREPEAKPGIDTDIIKALHPKEVRGTCVDLSTNNELHENLEQRAALMARIDHDKNRCKEIEDEIRLLMGDAETVLGLPDWRITYKTSKIEGYTVKPREQRVLRIYDKRPLEHRPQT